MFCRAINTSLLVGAILFAPHSLPSAPVWAEGGALTEREKLKSELRALEERAHPFVEAFRKVTQLVSPSVVSIRTEKGGKYVGGHRRGSGPGRQEFNVPMPYPHSHEGRSNPHPGFEYPQHGQGSGIIIDAEGHILTNYHVVEGFEEGIITVIAHDGRQYEARVVGLDSKTDLGILKIDGDGFQPAEFGSADDVHVGDWVIAIGNPFGYQQTVSAGIVSATGRKGVIPFSKPFSYEDFIQTDAAINPGNSGGPLVNLRGEVIGINTAIATRTGGFQGVGFAISVAIAKEVIHDLVEKGRVVRGYLGVGIRDINEDLAHMLGYSGVKEFLAEYGLRSKEGAFVTEVWDDTPAAKGRIEPGDVIIVLDNEKVFNADTVQRYIRHTKVGVTVTVVVIRNKDTHVLDIKVEEQPEDLGDRSYVSITQRVMPENSPLD